MYCLEHIPSYLILWGLCLGFLVILQFYKQKIICRKLRVKQIICVCRCANKFRLVEVQLTSSLHCGRASFCIYEANSFGLLGGLTYLSDL